MIPGVTVLLLCVGFINAYVLPQCSSDDNSQIIYPDAESKIHYFICENEILTRKKCEDHKVFDITNLECIEGFDKQEYLFPGSEMISISVNEPNSAILQDLSDVPQCNKEDEFKEPVPGSCSKFYYCSHGTLYTYRCFILFRFDPVTLKCKWFWKVDCNALHTTEATTEGTTITTEETTVTTEASTTTEPPNSFESFVNPDNLGILADTESKLDGINSRKLLSLSIYNEDYQCSSKGTYDDVYPGNCHKYYHCNEGDLSIKSCSFFKNFDPRKLECRLFFLVDCHAKPLTTTTIATTTTTEITETPEPEPTTSEQTVTSSEIPSTTIEPTVTSSEKPSTTEPSSTSSETIPTTLPSTSSTEPETTTEIQTTTTEPTTTTKKKTKPTKHKKTKKTTRKHHTKKKYNSINPTNSVNYRSYFLNELLPKQVLGFSLNNIKCIATFLKEKKQHDIPIVNRNEVGLSVVTEELMENTPENL